ncbi:hypothetical protein AVEN_103940-1 [Araneus ventricosus]|uniref:Uncharacterized protein n=1 Tax=Araneus ventricosus TaxID=182803 RepID=A0A4Y2I8C6_ARAVE|nr:hypothetical protein AVEN_103940-1 [Araneus ventricosus]
MGPLHAKAYVVAKCLPMAWCIRNPPRLRQPNWLQDKGRSEGDEDHQYEEDPYTTERTQNPGVPDLEWKVPALVSSWSSERDLKSRGPSQNCLRIASKRDVNL